MVANYLLNGMILQVTLLCTWVEKSLDATKGMERFWGLTQLAKKMDPKWRCIPIKIGMFHCYNYQRIPKNNGDRIQEPADTRMWHVITRKLPTKTSWIYDSKATKDVVDLQTLGATWIWQYMWLIWKKCVYIYNFCIHSCQNSGLQWILWKLQRAPTQMEMMMYP